MLWTYYNGLWSEWLNWSDQHLSSLDSRWRNLYSTVVSIFRLSAAESILTFIIILPAIIVQILLFLDKNISYTYLEEKETIPNPNEIVPNTTFDQIEVKQK